MPFIADSTYRPSWLYRPAHTSTILPTLLRRPPALSLRRERFELPDGDFIDLDYSEGEFQRVVILCHGLEGNSRRKYMLGMAAAFLRRGWDVVGYNFRGCSGEPNRLACSYHAGATYDLRSVIEQVARRQPETLALVGFSLGGNLVLKYLGEDPAAVHPALCAAAAFSAPVNLGDSCSVLDEPHNWVYQQRFLRKLRKKVAGKAVQHPESVDVERLATAKTIWGFDDVYTAPLHGFRDAADYYDRNSSRQFLNAIRIPTLLVNARNDPFLSPTCYPRAEAEASSFFHLETPRYGGHVGFHAPGPEYWSEQRAVEFVSAARPAESN